MSGSLPVRILFQNIFVDSFDTDHRYIYETAFALFLMEVGSILAVFL